MFYFLFDDTATNEIYPLSLHDALPISEGLHRDGVDWVLVMLVTRENIAEGVTSIHDAAKTLVGRFTLTEDRKSTRLNSSHVEISYAVFCLKKKKKKDFK